MIGNRALKIILFFYLLLEIGHSKTPFKETHLLSIQKWRESSFFSQNDGYSEIIKEGMGMHPQAVEQILYLLTDWIKNKQDMTLSFLDVACGTQTPVVPFFIAQYLAKANISLRYKGVDINQSLQTVHFSFPKNVISQQLFVENAYLIKKTQVKEDEFSIIYSGLNVHHLSPREFLKATRNYKSLLKKDGVIIFFDLFRPKEFSYIPKPESKRVMDTKELLDVNENNLFIDPTGRFDWKEVFVKIYTDYAKTKQITEKTIEQVSSHSLENDYPMSMQEVTMLLQQNGYIVEKSIPFHTLYPDIPISPFFGVIIAHL